MSDTSQRIADLSPARKACSACRASSEKGERAEIDLTRSPTISRGYGFSTNWRRRASVYNVNFAARICIRDRCSGTASGRFRR